MGHFRLDVKEEFRKRCFAVLGHARASRVMFCARPWLLYSRKRGVPPAVFPEFDCSGLGSPTNQSGASVMEIMHGLFAFTVVELVLLIELKNGRKRNPLYNAHRGERKGVAAMAIYN